jgi:serine/threonine-protein phosphatase 2B catalytic subunit
MNVIILSAHQILSRNFNYLENESNLVRIQSPVLLVGDIHGQFYDLLTIFKKYDFKTQKFLFLGDYVDRGSFCVEVVTLILLLKILYPKSIHLLRGNHEGRVMTTHFNFKTECKFI